MLLELGKSFSSVDVDYFSFHFNFIDFVFITMLRLFYILEPIRMVLFTEKSGI